MKNIKFAILSLLTLVFAFSCSDEESRIPDTGDLEMGIVVPGNESVTLCLDIKDNSSATRAEVSWGEGKTTSFDIKGKQVQQKIAVPEGSYIFRVMVYDASGNQVINFPMAGRSYGASYIGTLKNSRVPIKFRLSPEKDVNITWAENPRGCLRSVVSYIKAGETEPTVINVTAGETTTFLEKPALEIDEDGKEVFRFEVMSYYYPDVLLLNTETRPVSVPADIVFDEFPSTITKYDNGPVDVTSVYIKNAGPDMKGTPGADARFGNLADWQTNTAAKNRDGNTYGGWKGGHIGWEVGWGADLITNGKVWQSPTLPEGTYDLSVDFGGTMTDWVDLNLVVAPGAELPNVENLSTDAIAYLRLVKDSAGNGGERKITFKLDGDQQVSIGVVVTANGGEAAWIDAVNWFKLVDLKIYDE